MGKKSTPKHQGYVKMKDTPWIKQGREIASIGGQGILDNYGRVNVFDEATRNDINRINEDTYNRAFGDAERNYMNTMNKYNAANYSRFGTLNATAPYNITDQYQRDFQRQMNDLAYNKAVNYENLYDKELQRRYNTLNMFGNLYQYGNTPYQQDLKNWNIQNTNRDIAYQNAVAAAQNGTNWGSIAGGVLGGVAGAMTGNPMLAIGGAQAGSQIGGMI